MSLSWDVFISFVKQGGRLGFPSLVWVVSRNSKKPEGWVKSCQKEYIKIAHWLLKFLFWDSISNTKSSFSYFNETLKQAPSRTNLKLTLDPKVRHRRLIQRSCLKNISIWRSLPNPTIGWKISLGKTHQLLPKPVVILYSNSAFFERVKYQH